MVAIVDKPSIHISDPARVAWLKSQVFKLWGLPNGHTSPCPLPVSISHSNLQTIANEPYVVGCKLDGVRYLFMLTQYPYILGGQEVAVLVDRAWKMYPIYVLAKKAMFVKGCLFDGELINVPIPSVMNKFRQIYCVFDVMNICGENVTGNDFFRRVNEVKKYFFTGDEDMLMLQSPQQWKSQGMHWVKQYNYIVSCGNKYYLGFRVKQWLPTNQVETIFRCGGQMGAPSDGIIFMPLADQVCATRLHRRMFKWKTDHTIDLIIKNDELFYWNDLLRALCSDPITMVNGRKRALMCINTPNINHECVSEFKIMDIVASPDEDNLDNVLLMWIDFRDDKENSNTLQTLQITIDNFENPVLMEEIVDACLNNTVNAQTMDMLTCSH